MTTSKTLFFLVFITSFHPTLQNNKYSENSFPLKLVRLSDEASAFNRKNHVLPQSSPRATNYPQLPFKYPSMALIASVPIGTPSQNIQMVLDTGSQLMWMACDVRSSFQHSRSNTFSYLSCNNKRLTCPISDNTLGVSCNRSTHQCGYSYFYADGTFAEVILVNETFTFSASETNPSLILGCTSKADSSGAEGILGMNLGPLSFISQLKVQTFSYCVPNHGKNNPTGRLCLGPNPNSRSFRYVNLSKPPGYKLPNYDYLAYSVPWVAIKIGGKTLEVPREDRNGYGQTMIDSASQYTYLVDAVYSKLKGQVLRLAGSKLKKRYIYQDLELCFDGNSGEIGNMVGDMVFEFGNHTSPVSVLISKGKIFDEVHRGVSCFTILSSDLLGSNNIIGNFHQQNYWVEYDLKNNRVGFGNTSDCSK